MFFFPPFSAVGVGVASVVVVVCFPFSSYGFLPNLRGQHSQMILNQIHHIHLMIRIFAKIRYQLCTIITSLSHVMTVRCE